MVPTCMRWLCNKDPTIICKKCDIVHYCSQECRQIDSPAHNIICRDSRAMMLKAYYEYLVVTKMFSVHLSSPTLRIIDNRTLIIGLSNKCVCILCFSYNNVYGRNDIKLAKHVHYSRCDDCCRYELCPIEFIERRKCVCAINYLVLQTYMKKYPEYPSDIFNYIIGIARNIQCLCSDI